MLPDILECRRILEEFLSFPLVNASAVLERFAALPNAVAGRGGGKSNYVFVPGTRSDRIVIAAHADTVWDSYYYGANLAFPQKPICRNGVYSGLYEGHGIGADDRAGCAMLWLLRESGHSLLILDGEEHGQIGAHYLKDSNPELFAEVNAHNYIIQLDRRGSKDFKTYSIPVTDEFRSYIAGKTGYLDAGYRARTDIVVLCEKICGVNLSVGYYNEHSGEESLVFDDWYHTLQLVADLLSAEQPAFPLSSE